MFLYFETKGVLILRGKGLLYPEIANLLENMISHGFVWEKPIFCYSKPGYARSTPGTTVPVTAPCPLTAPPAVQQVDQQAAPPLGNVWCLCVIPESYPRTNYSDYSEPSTLRALSLGLPGLPQGPKTCVAQKLLKLYCLEFTSHNCTGELPEWRILDMGYQSKPGMDISGLEGLFDRDIPKIILALCQRVNITKPKSSMEWLSCELPKKARSIQRDEVFPSPPAFLSLRLSTWKWSMCPSSHKIWYCWGKGLW